MNVGCARAGPRIEKRHSVFFIFFVRLFIRWRVRCLLIAPGKYTRGAQIANDEMVAKATCSRRANDVVIRHCRAPRPPVKRIHF